MTCSHCRGPVEWDVAPGLPIPPEPHTVCLMCGAVDSQRERLSNGGMTGDFILKPVDVNVVMSIKKSTRKYSKNVYPRRIYEPAERAIIRDASLTMNEVMELLADKGYERTYAAVSVWRSTHKDQMVGTPADGRKVRR